MSTGESSDPKEDWSDPDLEARMLASIMGESSGFEEEAVERAVEGEPGAQAARDRLAAMHDLLGGVVRPADDAEWKLAPDRRAKLKRTLGIDGRGNGNHNGNGESARDIRIRRAGRRVLWAAAACIVVNVFLFLWLATRFAESDRGAAAGSEADAVIGGSRYSMELSEEKQAPAPPTVALLDDSGGFESASADDPFAAAEPESAPMDDADPFVVADSESLLMAKPDPFGAEEEAELPLKPAAVAANVGSGGVASPLDQNTNGFPVTPAQPSAGLSTNVEFAELPKEALAEVEELKKQIVPHRITGMVAPKSAPAKRPAAGELQPVDGISVPVPQQPGQSRAIQGFGEVPANRPKRAAPKSSSAATIASGQRIEVPNSELSFGDGEDFGTGWGLGAEERPQAGGGFGGGGGAGRAGFVFEGTVTGEPGDGTIPVSGRIFTGNEGALPVSGGIIDRKEATAESDDLLMEGREAYKQGNYDGAVQKYREALDSLPSGEETLTRRDSISAHLADGSVAQAQQLRRTGRYAEARDTLEKSLALDPDNEHAKRELGYLEDPIRSGQALTFEHSAQVDKIRRNLYRAEGYKDLGRYKEALEQYADVLRADPYNKAARQGVERIGRLKNDYYRAAYDETRATLLSEVDEGWEMSVPPGSSESPGGAGSLFVQRWADLPAKVLERWQSGLGDDGPDVSDLLKARGVTFADGAGAEWIPGSGERGTLVVRNGREEMIVVQRILDEELGVIEQTRSVEAGAERLVADEPYSTFSLHISDVSFKLAQAALEKGEWPESGSVRVEEFVNAFDYRDPPPSQQERVACRVEQAVHPSLLQRNLVRVSMRTASLGRAAGIPLRLTVLLDHSGSMDRVDRRESVRRAFDLLAAQLAPQDQLTLISFAREPRLIADRISGAEVARLSGRIEVTPSEGGTNLEAALRMGLGKAQEQFAEGGQNRIILLTDGAANLGNAVPEELARLVERMRGSGIAFDACGVGADGLNDEILEALSRQGDGRYYLLDRPEDADEGFARQIAGALRPAARNVKVQVQFNPQRVRRYALYGFEKHRLKKEDFRNDSVDAAEMAAEESGNAIYQVQVLPEGSGEIGTVSVRFQDTESGRMVEKAWSIPYDPAAPDLRAAAPSMRLAGGAALLGQRIKGGPLGEVVEPSDLVRVVSDLPASFSAPRVRKLVEMTRAVQEMTQ